MFTNFHHLLPNITNLCHFLPTFIQLLPTYSMFLPPYTRFYYPPPTFTNFLSPFTNFHKLLYYFSLIKHVSFYLLTCTNLIILVGCHATVINSLFVCFLDALCCLFYYYYYHYYYHYCQSFLFDSSIVHGSSFKYNVHTILKHAHATLK